VSKVVPRRKPGARRLYVKELDSSRTAAPNRNTGQREEVRKDVFSLCGSDGFGVKLNPIHREAPVAEGHYFLAWGTVAGPGGNL